MNLLNQNLQSVRAQKGNARVLFKDTLLNFGLCGESSEHCKHCTMYIIGNGYQMNGDKDEHIFNCRAKPTTMTASTLWDKPIDVAIHLGL